RRAAAEIFRLLRARARAGKRRLASRQGVFVRGPVAFPDDRRIALRLSPGDGKAGAEIPAVGRAARARRGAAARRRLSRVETADRFQPARNLQALSGTRRLAPGEWNEIHAEEHRLFARFRLRRAPAAGDGAGLPGARNPL